MTARNKAYALALGDVMKRYRAHHKLGLRELARMFGMSPATLSRIEHGYGCDLDKLVVIHQRTGITYMSLLGDYK